jgi:hypothetical protein
VTPIFSHREPAPLSTNDYRRFRPYIREDFSTCCAYCLLTELLGSGKENFELDHFKPRSRFPELVSEYKNIYYACHVCNNIKRDSWPLNELADQGYRYFDPCYDDFSAHFEESDGRWEPTTRVGEYSVERLRLNRDHLIQVRRLLIQRLDELGEPPVDWNRPLRLQITAIERPSP